VDLRTESSADAVVEGGDATESSAAVIQIPIHPLLPLMTKTK
jgi:hypothetical protein